MWPLFILAALVLVLRKKSSTAASPRPAMPPGSLPPVFRGGDPAEHPLEPVAAASFNYEYRDAQGNIWTAGVFHSRAEFDALYKNVTVLREIPV